MTVPFDGITETNPCTGEEITLAGDVHLVGWTDPDLGILTKFHENSQGLSAVSSTGVQYTVVESLQEVLQPSFDSANVTHITLNDRFISRDGSENFVVHETLQIVYDANGNPRVFHTSGQIDCQG